jgi:Fe2+ or Zn2+ uptake regulation protein
MGERAKLTDALQDMLQRLGRVRGSGTASTSHLRYQSPYVSGAQARRALHCLAKLGFVTPITSRGGLTFWWCITDAGRAALAEEER